MSWWSERMLDWAMARPGVQDAALPLRRRVPRAGRQRRRARAPVRVLRRRRRSHGSSTWASTSPTTCRSVAPIEARVARRNIMRMAEQFIVGQTAAEAVEGLHLLWRSGSRRHGRPARREDRRRGGGRPVRGPGRRAAPRRCLRRAAHWAPDDHLERDDLGPIPRVNVSIKPTALAAHYEPLTRRRRNRAGQGSHPPAAPARPRAAARSCTSTWSTTTSRT